MPMSIQRPCVLGVWIRYAGRLAGHVGRVVSITVSGRAFAIVWSSPQQWGHGAGMHVHWYIVDCGPKSETTERELKTLCLRGPPTACGGLYSATVDAPMLQL